MPSITLTFARASSSSDRVRSRSLFSEALCAATRVSIVRCRSCTSWCERNRSCSIFVFSWMTSFTRASAFDSASWHTSSALHLRRILVGHLHVRRLAAHHLLQRVHLLHRLVGLRLRIFVTVKEGLSDPGKDMSCCSRVSASFLDLLFATDLLSFASSFSFAALSASSESTSNRMTDPA